MIRHATAPATAQPQDVDFRRLKWTDNVRPVSPATAAKVLEKFESTPMAGETVRYMLGFFKDDELRGCPKRSKPFHISVGMFGKVLGDGEPKLVDLTPRNLERFFDTLVSNGTAPVVAQGHSGRLHRLLRYAVRNQFVATSEGGCPL